MGNRRKGHGYGYSGIDPSLVLLVLALGAIACLGLMALTHTSITKAFTPEYIQVIGLLITAAPFGVAIVAVLAWAVVSLTRALTELAATRHSVQAQQHAAPRRTAPGTVLPALPAPTPQAPGEIQIEWSEQFDTQEVA